MTGLQLVDVIDNGLCTGCGGCVAAIARDGLVMRMTDAGYLRPTPLPLGATDSTTLATVCAGRALEHRPAGTAGADYHPLWGPIASVSTGHAADPNVRHACSSGGVLTALGRLLVDSGMVDFVLSTSASPNAPIDNATLPRRSAEAVLQAAGSRYAPSTPLADLERHLTAGRPFAFVGKPCDVATLRRMARRDPRIDALIPYKLSFFCAGVPSRRGTLDMLNALGVAPHDVASLQFRGDGWPGLARVWRHDGTEESMDYNQSWGTILNRHLQYRCKICPDGTGEFADIACADAWYGKDGYPDFDERDGRSLIVGRTPVGQALLAAALEQGAIVSEPLDVAEIERMQPYQADRKRNAMARSAATWVARGAGPRFRRLGLLGLALRGSWIAQLRNAIGTFRRAQGRQLD